MKKQISYHPPLPFRAPPITKKYLKQLKNEWGTNQSQAIIRCIERVWLQEIGNQKTNQEKRKES